MWLIKCPYLEIFKLNKTFQKIKKKMTPARLEQSTPDLQPDTLSICATEPDILCKWFLYDQLEVLVLPSTLVSFSTIYFIRIPPRFISANVMFCVYMQYRIQRPSKGGPETWNLCSHLWRPFLFYWFLQAQGIMAPSAPSRISYWHDNYSGSGAWYKVTLTGTNPIFL